MVSIGDYAFTGCINLEKIILGTNIINLGDGIVNNTAYAKKS